MLRAAERWPVCHEPVTQAPCCTRRSSPLKVRPLGQHRGHKAFQKSIYNSKYIHRKKREREKDFKSFTKTTEGGQNATKSPCSPTYPRMFTAGAFGRPT